MPSNNSEQSRKDSKKKVPCLPVITQHSPNQLSFCCLSLRSQSPGGNVTPSAVLKCHCDVARCNHEEIPDKRKRESGGEGKKASLLASHGTAAGTERGKAGGGYGRIVITSNCLV